MRIPRTNFSPASFHDGNPSGEPVETGTGGWDETWSHPVTEDDKHATGQARKPRFRSAILQTYDPETQASDGSWDSHFYMAPNVRFTRTPDRRKDQAPGSEEAAPPPIEDARIATGGPAQALAAPLADLPSDSALLQRLRDALDERRRRFEPPVLPARDAQDALASFVQPPAVATPVRHDRPPALIVKKDRRPMAATVPPEAEPAQRVHACDTRTNHLSDFAFWESLSMGAGTLPDMPAASAPVPAPLPVTPAIKVPPDSIAGLFRVVECRTSPLSGRQPGAVSIEVALEQSADRDVETKQPAAVPGPVAVAAVETAAPVAAIQRSPLQPQPRPETKTSGLTIAKPFQIDLKASPAKGDAAYVFPSHDLLQLPSASNGFVMSQEQLEQNAGLLESVLEDFGVRGEIIHVRPGPVVTLYEFEPAPGVKSSRVIGLADDIARSMSALSARVAVVPGRNVIGIELPNATRETVYFREMIDSPDFARSGYKLPLCLGKTIGGEPVIAELAKMPHLLVAGTTGSGKSVAINTMILSLLYRFRPEDCRLIMVDPKMLELSIYDGIPHLLTPVVTDPKKAVMALKWAVREMEDRYRKMSRLGVRNIDGYNSRVASARKKGETIELTVQTGFDKGTGEAINEQQELALDQMPYIVVIVDEMADLMMVAGKEIEGAIQRLAQMARAAGIHLIMATQRPSVDVITGTIKANFPTRISFQVTSKIDSRTILGEQGAEQLLGQGDMLHMAGGGRISRVHGPFVSDEEVEKVVMHLKTQGRPDYLDTVTADECDDEAEDEAAGAVFDKGDIAAEDGNDLYDKAVKVVMRDKKCSTSYIQRRLGIGYNRAASLVERMEKEGLVGAANHVGKREIITGERDTAPVRAED